MFEQLRDYEPRAEETRFFYALEDMLEKLELGCGNETSGLFKKFLDSPKNTPFLAYYANDIWMVVKDRPEALARIASRLDRFCVPLPSNDDEEGRLNYAPIEILWDCCLKHPDPQIQQNAIESFMCYSDDENHTLILPVSTATLLLETAKILVKQERASLIERVFLHCENKQALWPHVEHDVLATESSFYRFCERFLCAASLAPEQEKTLIYQATQEPLASMRSILAVEYAGKYRGTCLWEQAPGLIEQISTDFFSTFQDIPEPVENENDQTQIAFINLLVQYSPPESVTQWITHILENPQINSQELQVLLKINHPWPDVLAEKILQKIQGDVEAASMVHFVVAHTKLSLSHPQVYATLSTSMTLCRDTFNTFLALQKKCPTITDDTDSILNILSGYAPQPIIQFLLEIPDELFQAGMAAQ